jgi:hydrophobic/amphiphilic exporter-1 (mainly G- bacteria), HAE1 family
VMMIVANATTDVNALGQLPVGTTMTAPLSQVATINQGTGPVQIVRIDGQRAATISGSITSEETGGVNQDIQKIVDDFDAPEGVEVLVGGVSQDQSEAFASMGIALLIAVVLVYIVMVASFGSLTTPFVILFSLPLALIGVLLALALTGKSIGLPALIGVLMLIGIVVTNAIVLLEYVLELRHQGLTLKDALIEGGKTRIRPIVMTALATILALIPLALTENSGAIIASDLAVVVIGGLLTSTVLTLIVVPVIFELIGGWQDRRSQRQAAKEAAAHVAPPTRSSETAAPA